MDYDALWIIAGMFAALVVFTVYEHWDYLKKRNDRKRNERKN